MPPSIMPMLFTTDENSPMPFGWRTPKGATAQMMKQMMQKKRYIQMQHFIGTECIAVLDVAQIFMSARFKDLVNTVVNLKTNKKIISFDIRKEKTWK